MDSAELLDRLRNKRHILLLQGPVGPFFDRLARLLLACGREVTKVNFNGGDEWFYSVPGAVAYREPPDHWPKFFDALVDARGIDAVVLFGDCRPYHRSAILRARLRRLAVFVFEEGYIRPNYVTFEYGGVNGHSPLPRSPALLELAPVEKAAAQIPGRPFHNMALQAALYYFMGRIRREQYPNYRHHKPFDLYPEGWYWLRALWRKRHYRARERGLEEWLAGPMKKRFFLVPLQVFNDSQVKHHSDFKGVRAFITTVLESFARHAPKNVHLVFKHHPMDRGHRDYADQIDRQAAHAGVGDRVHYVHDQHLPTLLRTARGTVAINSTVGLSSLFHGTPVKLMGRAIYDLPKLVFDGPLDAFWHRPPPPCRATVRRFRQYLIHTTQVAGTFYSWDQLPVPEAELIDGAEADVPR